MRLRSEHKDFAHLLTAQQLQEAQYIAEAVLDAASAESTGQTDGH